MSTEQQPSRPSRGGAGAGGGAAPVGSTVAIVVAVVAVVLGFVILRDLRNDDGTDAGGTDGSEQTIPDASSTTVPTTPQSTTTTLTMAGASIAVANASGFPGTARIWSTALQARGFTVVDPVNASGAEARLDVTRVYVQPGSEAVANSVAAILGVEVFPMPSPFPVQGESIGAATVLIMLGRDIAQRTLSEVESAGGSAATTTPAPATAQPPAG